MEDPGKTKGIIALILGIVGLISAWFFGIGTIFGIVAIILAIASGNASQAAGLKRSGVAVAGLILGILAVVSGAGCLIRTVCTCAAGGSEYSSYSSMLDSMS